MLANNFYIADFSDDDGWGLLSFPVDDPEYRRRAYVEPLKEKIQTGRRGSIRMGRAKYLNKHTVSMKDPAKLQTKRAKDAIKKSRYKAVESAMNIRKHLKGAAISAVVGGGLGYLGHKAYKMLTKKSLANATGVGGFLKKTGETAAQGARDVFEKDKLKAALLAAGGAGAAGLGLGAATSNSKKN